MPNIELSRPYFLVVVDDSVRYTEFDSTLGIYVAHMKYIGRVLQVSHEGHTFLKNGDPLKNGDVVEFRMDFPIKITHEGTSYYIIHVDELLGKIEAST